MEVTVVETGDLPEGTIISFHTGSIRRHAHLEKDKAINVSYVSGSEPVRVDLMSQVGNYSFDMVPGQQTYKVPIKPNPVLGLNEDVLLTFQIREASASSESKGGEDLASAEGVDGAVPGSPSKKLHTALMMRSYLDNHDVLRQMQELLQDMVTQRPEDPIEYMIQRLEEVCHDNQMVDYDMINGHISGTVVQVATTQPRPDVAVAKETPEEELPECQASKKKKDHNGGSDSEGSDDDNVPDLPPPPPPGFATRKRGSVSDEAYGKFNERKAYQAKVIAKDESQKARLKEVLSQCWMFENQTPGNLNTIIDALEEKIVEPGVRCVQQGDDGEVMWVIEEGVLECFKLINGEEKSVKICKRGDVFGELALLYGCPRAASVDAKERCILWQLDRETFKAICYEAATKAQQPQYEGFDASKMKAADSRDVDAGDQPEIIPKPPEGKSQASNGRQKTRRREGVSAEAMKGGDDNWTPPFYEKTSEERQQLSNIIRTSHDGKLHMLFGSVSNETFEKIVDAMFAKKLKQGEDVIQMGAVGDYFYIVKEGLFDIFVKKGDEPLKKVFQAEIGFAFGELALLYNAPRSATITAACDAEVWCLDRAAFRNLVVRSAEAQFKRYCDFLRGVDVFGALSDGELFSLAEVLEEETFQDDEAIVEQGEHDDKMFILQSGQAVACIQGEHGEVEVMSYKERDYFGEIALLSGEPRKATVYAVGPVTCLYITRATFVRILGPLASMLQRNMERYAKYQDAIDNSLIEESADIQDEADDEHDSSRVKTKLKAKFRKREHKEVLENVNAHKVVSELQTEETPVETLADKVAKDFDNETLVSPCQSFVMPDVQMLMFGGLLPHQKFTMDKLIHVRTAVQMKSASGEDSYSWQGLTKMKGLTDISVVCQKGQKSASDPTPNQDNFFVKHIGPVTMFGVLDGHGPFGHLVSFRLAQSLPYFIAKSEHFGKDWALCLKQGFLDAEDDLEEFCRLQDINIEASGAAGSVLLQEEQTVHIAFIGDARIMLGSWNRRDSRMIHCTRDHKPNLPEEKTRLEAAGSEVRELDPGNHRIYLPGSNFPGLTMSRAFGDTACGGVLREPEYIKFLMQPTDQWYAIVASDGIWEFLEGEEVCNMSSKKLRLKGTRETVQFLVSASRKRWAHVCNDYCDDITAIMVQWNCPDAAREADTNHQLIVKRPE